MTVIPFSFSNATLQNAGGKGANLARLAQAGFPVPPGFILATDAYQSYVEANQLADAIDANLQSLAAGEAEGLELASRQIRAAFSAGRLPDELRSEILDAYTKLKAPPVAVRSSATTEDLPELSFAGQQDTFLNVRGEQALLKAVVDCWSSLWTARAIGYRLRNGIPQDQARLAVVVQAMVDSQVSGVLFTANPLTGRRDQAVIDATFGLGEALVSGQVEPDHFVLDTRNGKLVERALGAKQVATRGLEGGGTHTVREQASDRQTLDEGQIRELAALGERIEAAFGAPQDIEWALAGGELYTLQSRPITSLFPLPEISFEPLKIWFSFGAVQGLVGPITPLGQDTIRGVASGAARIFGVNISSEKQTIFVLAGQRIWIRVSDVIRNPVGAKILPPALGTIEPSIGQIVAALAQEPEVGKGSGRLKPGTLLRIARAAVPILFELARNVLFPEKGRAEFEAVIRESLATARVKPGNDRFERLANTVLFIRRQVASALPFLLPRFIPVFGPSMAGMNLLREAAGDRPELALQATRALPGNVTTGMDLALWAASQTIRQDAAAREFFESRPASELSKAYVQAELPDAAQTALGDFMQKYGMRGVGEIDFGQPTWREEPAALMQTLKSYLEIDPDQGPQAQFERGERAAREAIETLAGMARRGRFGWLKEKQVRFAARRVRTLMGARESPKFFAIRMMGIGRLALTEVGKEFARAGTVRQADDLVFLKLAELEALARGEDRDWRAIVAERRATYAREQRRRQVPRVLVSDGRAFYEGLGGQAGSGEAIRGSPVSPGVVEGAVRVVFDPGATRLEPGEILVCPGTDPAWTPLFMQAGGLITEVGGMMTHGSVVAREYGIPAVVGVHEATSRLKDGVRIRLDGTSGRIEILED